MHQYKDHITSGKSLFSKLQRNHKADVELNSHQEILTPLKQEYIKERWTFLDKMEDNLKDVLNYYESFCNELADFENDNNIEDEGSFMSDKENIPPMMNPQMNDSSGKSVKHCQLEIIEEKDSIPTTTEYSPMARVETEPIRYKRESCSELFRRSKAERACKSNTSVNMSSSDSSNIKIQPSDTSDSYDDKFVAIELEEGIEESEESESENDEEDDSFVYDFEENKTFESKVSSTYIESNEEFMYSTKDLLPGPLKLELIKNIKDDKVIFERGSVKPTLEF